MSDIHTKISAIISNNGSVDSIIDALTHINNIIHSLKTENAVLKKENDLLSKHYDKISDSSSKIIKLQSEQIDSLNKLVDMITKEKQEMLIEENKKLSQHLSDQLQSSKSHNI